MLPGDSNPPASLAPTFHLHTRQESGWPRFPTSYRALSDFSMPEPTRDTSTNKSTAPWTGSGPPEHPLSFCYRDSTIIQRALAGLFDYIETGHGLDRPTPPKAAFLWEALEPQYERAQYHREGWIKPVLNQLCHIIGHLMQDLGLAPLMYMTTPTPLYNREDVDWIVESQPCPEEEIIDILLAQLRSPESSLSICPGSAMEAKLNRVLNNYRDFFAEPFQIFPMLAPYEHGHAMMFKLDLHMCHRILHDVSCTTPRFGLIYSGHQCVVMENRHPPLPRPPFEVGSHLRGPPNPPPHVNTSIRGAGHSDLQPLVPSQYAEDRPLIPFIALLLAINAPPGKLRFDEPDPTLSADGYKYLQEFSLRMKRPSVSYRTSAGTSTQSRPKQGKGAAKTKGKGKGTHSGLWSTFLLLKFPPPMSQEPQLLEKVTPSQLLSGLSGEQSLSMSHDHCPSFLSLNSVIPSGQDATVHRGTLDHDYPAIAKVYDIGSFAVLLRELEVYDCMTSSVSVPKCFGVFAPPHRAWAVLLLEDKGDALPDCWEDLTHGERRAVYKTARGIHAAGILHGDLASRNFVRDKHGRLYAIDFGRSSLGHRCTPETCAELRYLRQDLGLRISTTIR